MNKKYIVRLADEERGELESLVKNGRRRGSPCLLAVHHASLQL